MIRAIPIDDIDTVKIATWLLILFLRYNGPKIHTERRNNNNNNNEEKNKIRTNSIGDMPLYGISPNKISLQEKEKMKIKYVTYMYLFFSLLYIFHIFFNMMYLLHVHLRNLSHVNIIARYIEDFDRESSCLIQA